MVSGVEPQNISLNHTSTPLSVKIIGILGLFFSRIDIYFKFNTIPVDGLRVIFLLTDFVL